LAFVTACAVALGQKNTLEKPKVQQCRRAGDAAARVLPRFRDRRFSNHVSRFSSHAQVEL
jgi:hypothetical protein